MDTDDRWPAQDPGGQPRRPNPRPAPPQVSQRTYWIRRTVALLILIALITLVVFGVKAIVRAVTGAGNKDKGSNSAPQSSPTKETPASEQTPDTDKSNAPDEELEPAQADGPQECDPALLETTVGAPSTQFSVGQTNQFTVLTKYTGTEKCTLDVGVATRTLTIFSGDDRIWSSADCDQSGSSVMLMEKGTQDTSQIAWDMNRSEKGCTKDLPKAKPGTYRAILHTGGKDLEPYVFNVVN